MSYRIETLKPEEFQQLHKFHDGFVPDPQRSKAIVVKDGEELVGRIFLLAPVHIEGPYIAPEHRNGTVLLRLVEKAEAEAKEWGLSKLFAYGADGEMEGYLTRLGYTKQPWTVWAKELK